MKKRSAIILGLLLLALVSPAQDTLYIYQSGNVVAKRATVDIDSITFYSSDQPVIEPDNIHRYYLTTSHGDVMNASLDAETYAYSVTNENVSATVNGSYIPSGDPELKGMYEIESGSTLYHGIELPGKLFTTTLPVGNPHNRISFGVTADTDLSQTTVFQKLTGRYLWQTVNNSGDYEWGGMVLYEDGSYSWQVGPDSDLDFDPNLHFAGGGNGRWEVDAVDHSRLNFTEAGVTFSGASYAGQLLLIESGVGNGFSACIKYPDQPLSQAMVAGTYLWLGNSTEGDYRGTGNFVITSTGSNQTYYSNYTNNPYSTIEHSVFNNFERSSKIHNAYTATSVVDDEIEDDLFTTSFMFSPKGDLVIFLTWGNEKGIVSSGIGVNVNK